MSFILNKGRQGSLSNSDDAYSLGIEYAKKPEGARMNAAEIIAAQECQDDFWSGYNSIRGEQNDGVELTPIITKTTPTKKWWQ